MANDVPSVYGSKYVWIFALAFAGVTAAMYVNLTHGPAYAYTVLPAGIASDVASAFGWFAFPAAIAGGLVVYKGGKCSPPLIAGSIMTSLTVLIPLTGEMGSTPLIILAYGIAGWGPLFCGVPAMTLLVKSAGQYYPKNRVGSAVSVLSLLGFGLAVISTLVASSLVSTSYLWVFGWTSIFGVIAFIASLISLVGERGLEQ